MPEFSVEQSGVVTTITIPMKRIVGNEFWVLLSSDRHLDNPKSDRKLAKKHLDELKEKDGILVDIGDLFCAMQGKFDPRSYKPDLLPENRTGDYLGSLVRLALDHLAPYKENIALLGYGNHETAILKRSEFDLTNALVERLQDKGSPVVKGGMRGWVRFRFLFESGGEKPPSSITTMYYHHGYGGGGPVTRGVINTNRMATYLPDADLVVTGHIHESWTMNIPRVKLNQSFEEVAHEQLHVCSPTYKEEFLNAGGGFHHEKGRPPKPIGATWLKFEYTGKGIDIVPIRAK